VALSSLAAETLKIMGHDSWFQFFCVGSIASFVADILKLV